MFNLSHNLTVRNCTRLWKFEFYSGKMHAFQLFNHILQSLSLKKCIYPYNSRIRNILRLKRSNFNALKVALYAVRI